MLEFDRLSNEVFESLTRELSLLAIDANDNVAKPKLEIHENRLLAMDQSKVRKFSTILTDAFNLICSKKLPLVNRCIHAVRAILSEDRASEVYIEIISDTICLKGLKISLLLLFHKRVYFT